MSSLKKNQKRAIPALLNNPTIREAAQEAGVGDSTLRRWLREDKEFKAELRRAEAVLIDTLNRGMLALAEEALSALAAGMAESEEPKDRARAANWFLQRFIQLQDLTDIKERLSALEESSEESDWWSAVDE